MPRSALVLTPTTVMDGTHTANILLLGQYLAGNFTSASDGPGSTMIAHGSPLAPDRKGFMTFETDS